MSRLFVAVVPPAALVERLTALPRTDADGVRWTTPEQWHVTLRFLGETDPADAAAALSTVTVGAAVASLGPSVERLGDAVVVVPVRGLDGVAAAVRAATAHLGERVDPRPFVGHLTLARVRPGARCGLVGHPLAGELAVDEVALVESVLHPDGARHTVRAVHRLR